MEITLKDILTTYWAQTVLVTATIEFLLKRVLELRAKKIEEKQSLFQTNRNAVIMRFMDNYVQLQGLYRQILDVNFDVKKIESDEFIKLLSEKFEELYSSYFYFKLFLDPLEVLAILT